MGKWSMKRRIDNGQIAVCACAKISTSTAPPPLVAQALAEPIPRLRTSHLSVPCCKSLDIYLSYTLVKVDQVAFFASSSPNIDRKAIYIPSLNWYTARTRTYMGKGIEQRWTNALRDRLQDVETRYSVG